MDLKSKINIVCQQSLFNEMMLSDFKKSYTKMIVNDYFRKIMNNEIEIDNIIIDNEVDIKKLLSIFNNDKNIDNNFLNMVIGIFAFRINKVLYETKQ